MASSAQYDMIISARYSNMEHLGPMFYISLLTRAKVMVELGTGHGDATSMFNEVAKITDGMVYTIDISSEVLGRERLKNEPRVVFILSDSIKATESWDKGDIDVLYCDSDHSYERVYGELMAWEKFHPKVVFVHDPLLPDRAEPPQNWDTPTFPYFAMRDYCKKSGRVFFCFNFPQGLGLIV